MSNNSVSPYYYLHTFILFKQTSLLTRFLSYCHGLHERTFPAFDLQGFLLLRRVHLGPDPPNYLYIYTSLQLDVTIDFYSYEDDGD